MKNWGRWQRTFVGAKKHGGFKKWILLDATVPNDFTWEIFKYSLFNNYFF